MTQEERCFSEQISSLGTQFFVRHKHLLLGWLPSLWRLEAVIGVMSLAVSVCAALDWLCQGWMKRIEAEKAPRNE